MRRNAALGLSRWALGGVFAVLTTACAADHQGVAIQQHYISSGEELRTTPYAYNNPSPYGYHVPWGQPNGETVGYLSSDHFAPRPGLVCERGRHVCYTSSGIDAAETERYLGSREKWKREKAYGTPQTYFMMP